MRYTIGMAVHDDFDGVYFTLQSLRLYHDLRDVELVVVDNSNDRDLGRWVTQWKAARYFVETKIKGTAYPRQKVFEHATGDVVVCVDCHVLLAPGALDCLRMYYSANPLCQDLIQGPMLSDDLTFLCTHMKPEWNNTMLGIWAYDPRGKDPQAEAFEIGMQGLGLFACRKDAWPGFHPALRGFGGEEGYIHAKFQTLGRKTLCLPGLRWLHRFPRPGSKTYRSTMDDLLMNYLVGFMEIGRPLDEVYENFQNHVSNEAFIRAINVAQQRLSDTEAK